MSKQKVAAISKVKHKQKSKWLCVDCGSCTKLEHYFLKNDVWFNEAKMGETGMLCITCVERRIGRKLNRNDFTDCHLNDPRRYSKTAVLIDRLTRTD